ncbi:lasso peptide biosynthesis B2 protein [Sphingopyxis sp.]|jgi:hypothetical protein|uniref:lasso peptide biosynthesis B2 protein n=1 Tax=Sphingopyxis sp. TaxID=1908224 RepID=UPI002DFAA955|nr:lasso peptide biosynthesis B2 protein [Sphingopyxis sp.]
MASHRLRSHLSFCFIGSRAIFLDRAASRYFLLEDVGAEHMEAFVAGEASEGAISWLEDRGLIETGAASPAPFMAPSPIASLHDARLGTPRPWLLAEAMLAEMRSQRLLTRRSLGSLLDPSRHVGLEADLDRCRPIAAAIERASRYRDATDQCLARGLAMRAMLARRGQRADLVIGVMLPFAAHCWIQSGTTVLSDPLDRVVNFTPLLTVR